MDDYDWIAPGPDDKRPESRRVQEHTIRPSVEMPIRERASFLAPIMTGSTAEAAARGQTLTLVRPTKTEFWAKPKTQARIAEERRGYQEAASQTSFLDPELKALNPCPYAFHFEWTDADGRSHQATCDDWETAVMFYRREKAFGSAKPALENMEKVFNEEYPARGMAFAMGTHSRRAEQWLLVGVLRLDLVTQHSLVL